MWPGEARDTHSSLSARTILGVTGCLPLPPWPERAFHEPDSLRPSLMSPCGSKDQEDVIGNLQASFMHP